MVKYKNFEIVPEAEPDGTPRENYRDSFELRYLRNFVMFLTKDEFYDLKVLLNNAEVQLFGSDDVVELLNV